MYARGVDTSEPDASFLPISPRQKDSSVQSLRDNYLSLLRMDVEVKPHPTWPFTHRRRATFERC